MRKYYIHLPLGTLAFVVLEDCPTSFFEIVDIPTLVLSPTPGADFRLTNLVPHGTTVSYLDTIAALTYHFSTICGMPRHSLDIITDYGTIEVPEQSYSGEIRVALPRAKRVFTREVDLLGGISEPVITVTEYTTSRIIENVERLSRELLARLRIIDGLPNADRAISYKHTERGYEIVTTDKLPNADSVSPLVRLLSERGITGTVTTLVENRKMHFSISNNLTPYAVYADLAHTA